jgi:hypothetical protein
VHVCSEEFCFIGICSLPPLSRRMLLPIGSRSLSCPRVLLDLVDELAPEDKASVLKFDLTEASDAELGAAEPAAAVLVPALAGSLPSAADLEEAEEVTVWPVLAARTTCRIPILCRDSWRRRSAPRAPMAGVGHVGVIAGFVLVLCDQACLVLVRLCYCAVSSSEERDTSIARCFREKLLSRIRVLW